MRRTGLLLLALGAALWAAGCASTPRPGSGDIAFRLYWQGEDDLDLHVSEPGTGEHIHFMMRQTESGGELDVDCNAAPDRICGSPIENVFWPVGKAPDGLYIFWVELFQLPEAGREIPFTLDVLLGKTVIRTETESMSAASRSSVRFEYRYKKRS